MKPTANPGPDKASPAPPGADEARATSAGQMAPAPDVTVAGDHDPEAKALLRRYLDEIHSFRETGNQALRNLEARLASMPGQSGDEPMADPARPIQPVAQRPASPLMQPSLSAPEPRRSNDPSLKQRLSELSAYLHADLARESAEARASAPRPAVPSAQMQQPAQPRPQAQAAPQQQPAQPRPQAQAAPQQPVQPRPQVQAAPQQPVQPRPQVQAAPHQPAQPRPQAQAAPQQPPVQPRPKQRIHLQVPPQRPQGAQPQQQSRGPNQPVLDRAWFEERFAALRSSVDRLAEDIPLKRLDALEHQFRELMERLPVREASRDTRALDTSLRELAAYLADNRQWQHASDARMKTMEDRLEHLAGLVAQSTAAMSATVKGLETAAKVTGEKLMRATASVIIARLSDKIDKTNPAQQIDGVTRELAEIKRTRAAEGIEALRQEIAELARSSPSERVEALRLEVAALARAHSPDRLDQLHRDVSQIAANNPADRLEQLGREVAHLAAQSRMSARTTEDRLEQIEISLKQKARSTPQLPAAAEGPPPGPRVIDPKRNTHSELESYLNRQPDSDDDYDSDMIAAAQRAARLADSTARTAQARNGPVRYQIPYGEFLPDDHGPSSRIGLIVAVVILLLAGGVMLFLKAKQWTLTEPEHRPAAMLGEQPPAPKSKQARLGSPELRTPLVTETEVKAVRTETIKPVTVVTGSTPSAPPLGSRPMQLWVAANEPVAAPEPQISERKPAQEDAKLREAAIKGDPSAQFSVGQSYLSGKEGEAHLSGDDRLVRAARWFRRAAEGGHVPSQYRLATLYELGQGTQRDLAEAETWYERAASRGHIKAMHNLAVLSVSGDKRPASTIKAARWFREAAAHGLVDSQYNLGILYERGMGVPKSLAEAYFWFALAARQNDPNALEKRNAVGVRFTAAEREKMDSIVADWTPKARVEDVNRTAPEPPTVLEADGTVPAPKPVAATANSAVMRASWHPDVAAARPGSAQTNSAQLNVIAEAQRLLAERGYDPGPVDGRPGPRTEAAVRSFQRRAGLAETGQVTQSLIVKMAFLPL